ncbi:MAG: cob(I)yrinic acid a,c-diamide adenosyltransferase [Verrucomicrobia bacterium]|nr:cob(I)yrinic acid a,c-diamide adenosyltransferase [Verrucomicrobiota bacterium]
MSIATRTGDDGTTGLLYNRRVPKNHVRVEAVGAVDELNAALGMARAWCGEAGLNDKLLWAQKQLVVLMGELATDPEDRERYERDGFSSISSAQVSEVDGWVAAIEERNITYRGWATPGGTKAAGFFDWARVVCRRAERRVLDLRSAEERMNPEILRFLNRLADALWLFARVEEQAAV